MSQRNYPNKRSMFLKKSITTKLHCATLNSTTTIHTSYICHFGLLMKLTNVRIPVGWSSMAQHSYLASQKLGINHTDAHGWIRKHTEASIIHWTSISYKNLLADGIGAAHTCQIYSKLPYIVLKCKLFCITLIFLQDMKTIKQIINQTTNKTPE